MRVIHPILHRRFLWKGYSFDDAHVSQVGSLRATQGTLGRDRPVAILNMDEEEEDAPFNLDADDGQVGI